MPSISLSSSLRREYEDLFASCQVNPDRQDQVEQVVERVLRQRARYQEVAQRCGVPWAVIAVIHQMESGGRFDRHLHNGDPLAQRTTHVPAGRPRSGQPPFTWEASAEDALRFDRLHLRQDWSCGAALYAIERYNGWGYRLYHPEVLSPYLWSFSNHYSSGKYVADGRWSDSAVSQQVGAAVVLRRLSERGVFQFEAVAQGPRFVFAPDFTSSDGMDLQVFMNQFDGIFLRVDGQLGPRSSEAFKTLFGSYLQGDPRAANTT